MKPSAAGDSAGGETGARERVEGIKGGMAWRPYENRGEAECYHDPYGRQVPAAAHGPEMQAIDYLRKEVPGQAHPLLSMDVITDGSSVFVDQLSGQFNGSLVNISQHGQLAMRSLLEAHLKRFERDRRTNAVLRLYPFAWPVRSAQDAIDQPTPITIDPRVAFGRPVVSGTRVPTAEIAARLRAGEQMRSIAGDMRLDRRQVEDALRFHTQQAA